MATPTGEPRPLTGALIWRLSTRWRAAVDRALTPLDLTHAQYALLASLHRLTQTGARPSQRELADFSDLEPMFVSKLARALERAGLVRRHPNPADPRAVHLELTAQGRERLDAAFAIVGELHDRLMAPLGEPGDSRRLELRAMLVELLRHSDRLDPPNRAVTDAGED